MDVHELLAQASQHIAAAKPMAPMYIHLIVSALFPIYAGAHASLSRPSSAAKPSKKDKEDKEDKDAEEDEEEEDVVQKMEGLSPKDAVIFPITAGLVLAFLYWLIKRYGADLINLIMGWYFSGVGVYSVAKLLNDGLNMIVSFVLPDYVASKGKLWAANNVKRCYISEGKEGKDSETSELRQPSPLLPVDIYDGFFDIVWNIRQTIKQKYTTKAFVKDQFDFKANLTLVNALSAMLGLGSILYVNLVSKPWYLINLQGFAVCYSALQFMSPTSFTTGSLILSGLFFYDIWAVFFTPLMVTVAKNLDQPIKLVFPRPEEPSQTPGEPPVRSYSMLGLGDIVLPGIMIGLALRFDLYVFYLRKQQKKTSNAKGNDGQDAQNEEVEKAPYVPASGSRGEKFWTSSLKASAKPSKLSASFPKPYFTASMVGYVAGMLATLGVMSIFQHAQPALLYLVPGVLISLWGTGLVRGELKEMWQFSEAITGEQLDEDEQKKLSEEEEKERKRKAELGLFGRLWDEIVGSGGDEKKDGEDDKKEKEAAESKQQKDDGTLVAFSLKRYSPAASNKGSSTSEPSVEADAVLVNKEE
ncbi:peptidase A22B, signal peptide peptidase [Hortaea werneckii]|nr:peptidase A22B, signal peptide peptidase [Hortaea werneckii]KAI7592735.1 peptidase A22B, signal peptide peptidase [Hortaea werneckii]